MWSVCYWIWILTGFSFLSVRTGFTFQTYLTRAARFSRLPFHAQTALSFSTWNTWPSRNPILAGKSSVTLLRRNENVERRTRTRCGRASKIGREGSAFTHSGTLRTRETSKSYSALLPGWTLGTRRTWPSHLTPYAFVALLRFNHTGRNHRWRSRFSLRTSRARNTIFPLFEENFSHETKLI